MCTISTIYSIITRIPKCAWVLNKTGVKQFIVSGYNTAEVPQLPPERTIYTPIFLSTDSSLLVDYIFYSLSILSK